MAVMSDGTSGQPRPPWRRMSGSGSQPREAQEFGNFSVPNRMTKIAEEIEVFLRHRPGGQYFAGLDEVMQHLRNRDMACEQREILDIVARDTRLDGPLRFEYDGTRGFRMPDEPEPSRSAKRSRVDDRSQDNAAPPKRSRCRTPRVPDGFVLGYYTVVYRYQLPVHSTPHRLDQKDIYLGYLDRGDIVNVVEVHDLLDNGRVCARIESPQGWLHLHDTKTQQHYVVSQEDLIHCWCASNERAEQPSVNVSRVFK